MGRLLERTALNAALLVIDLQEKLVKVMPESEKVVDNTIRLIQAAHILEVAVMATEQYPRGLGPTVENIAALIPHRSEKMTFSSCKHAEILEQLHGRGIKHVTLAGIETHVCVAQTALDLLRMGFDVTVPADAVTSRSRIDWEFGIRRMEQAGAVLTTTEAVIFEWIGTAESPRFKEISALVK